MDDPSSPIPDDSPMFHFFFLLHKSKIALVYLIWKYLGKMIVSQFH
jgi:hypothetical protein